MRTRILPRRTWWTRRVWTTRPGNRSLRDGLIVWSCNIAAIRRDHDLIAAATDQDRPIGDHGRPVHQPLVGAPDGSTDLKSGRVQMRHETLTYQADGLTMQS